MPLSWSVKSCCKPVPLQSYSDCSSGDPNQSKASRSCSSGHCIGGWGRTTLLKAAVQRFRHWMPVKVSGLLCADIFPALVGYGCEDNVG